MFGEALWSAVNVIPTYFSLFKGKAGGEEWKYITVPNYPDSEVST